MAVLTDLITGVDVTALTVNDVYGLAERIAEEMLTGADISFKYPELNRTVSEWGAIIGSVRLPFTESRTVDPETMSKTAPAYPTANVLYFNEWTEKVYPAEWRRIDATKVLSGEMELAEFIAKAVNANIEGYRADVNASVKKAFSYAATGAGISKNAEIILDTATATAPAVSTADASILGALGQYEVLTAPTYDDIYQEVEKVATDMQFDNGTYSDGFECGATRDDLVIYAPLEFMAGQSIAYKTKLRQLEEFADLPEIKTTDGLSLAYTDANGEAQTRCIILIQDKRFLAHVERWRESQSGYDRDRKSEYNDLHVEDAIVCCPHFKGYAIVFDLPKDSGTLELVNA